MGIQCSHICSDNNCKLKCSSWVNLLTVLISGKRAEFFPSVVKSIIPLTESMRQLIASLREVHKFYRSSFKAAEKNPSRQAFSRRPKVPSEDLYTCVNSLEIRLHSVADRWVIVMVYWWWQYKMMTFVVDVGVTVMMVTVIWCWWLWLL